MFLSMAWCIGTPREAVPYGVRWFLGACFAGASANSATTPITTSMAIPISLYGAASVVCFGCQKCQKGNSG